MRDAVITDESDDTRTHKIFHALDELCLTFDLGKPSGWTPRSGNLSGHSKARFYQDSFIEEIEFDYLEIQVLEE